MTRVQRGHPGAVDVDAVDTDSANGTSTGRARRDVLRAAAAGAGTLALGTIPSVADAARAAPRGDRGDVARLLAVPDRERDLAWLRAALGVAVALELSTIPPYLTCLWSIGDHGSDAARLIEGIVLDEMFHLGLACNLLVAIGGTPQLLAAAPVYPTALPGGVRPGLTVYLSGLTREVVGDVLMGIEAPADPLARSRNAATVGEFYGCLRDAFARTRPPLATARQLAVGIGPDRLAPLVTLADVDHAIEVVKEQGEGTDAGPTAPVAGGRLSHYYAFGEIFHGRRVVRTTTGVWDFVGDPVPWPSVYPLGRVPADGWPDPDPRAAAALDRFNHEYTSLLADLEFAWAAGSSRALTAAVTRMRRLGDLAVSLMQMPLPGGDGCYGPEFRLVAAR